MGFKLFALLVRNEGMGFRGDSSYPGEHCRGPFHSIVTRARCTGTGVASQPGRETLQAT